jgi:hypothetical protein
MPIFALFVVAALGYALWSGRVKLAQVPPLLLALGGTMIAVRGGWIIGVPAIIIGVAWYRGLSLRLFGPSAEQTDEFALSKARGLLGVSAHDDADRIRHCHRQLISENHPDRGGNESRAAELNKARDILLEDLATKSV